MNEKNSLQYFYDVIDSNFEEYEKSKLNEDVYIDLKNNIAKAMLDTFKARYGEESAFYMHCSMVFMQTINDCIKSYLKLTPQQRTGEFHSYFFKVLKKNINESIRLEQENAPLGIAFGKETEKSCSARQRFRRIKKIYEDLCNYNDDLSEEQIIQEVAIIERTTVDDIRKFMPLIKAERISLTQQDSNGKFFSVIDAMQKGDRKINLEIPEDLIISRENMKSILDKIDEVFKIQDDKQLLSKIITFKILSCFNPKGNVEATNLSSNYDVISYLPDSYDLEVLLRGYGFIDNRLTRDFFEKGLLPQEKDLETSKGSVNKKWERFNKKLLEKYRPDLEEIMQD